MTLRKTILQALERCDGCSLDNKDDRNRVAEVLANELMAYRFKRWVVVKKGTRQVVHATMGPFDGTSSKEVEDDVAMVVAKHHSKSVLEALGWEVTQSDDELEAQFGD